MIRAGSSTDACPAALKRAGLRALEVGTLLALTLGCRPRAHEPELLRAASVVHTPVAQSQFDAGLAAQIPAEPMLAEDCSAGVDWSGDRSQLADALTLSCVAGYDVLAPARDVESNGVIAFQVADATRCIRILATADANTSHVSLKLFRELQQVSAVESPRRAAWLAEQGPTCLPEAGAYSVRAVSTPPAKLQLRVWQAR